MKVANSGVHLALNKTGPKLCCSNFLKSLSDGVQGLQWSDINMDILVNVSQNKEISMAYLVK